MGVWEGRSIKLRVTNTTEYTPNNVGWNRINDEFGVLNLWGGTGTGFFFELFYEDGAQEPAVLPGFGLVFYDFDMGAGTYAEPERSIEYVTTCGATEVLTSQELFDITPSIELFTDQSGPFSITNVPVADPALPCVGVDTAGCQGNPSEGDDSEWTGTPEPVAAKCTSARARRWGQDSDNPTSASDLNDEQASKAFFAVYEETSSWDVFYGATGTAFGRNFLFAFDANVFPPCGSCDVPDGCAAECWVVQGDAGEGSCAAGPASCVGTVATDGSACCNLPPTCSPPSPPPPCSPPPGCESILGTDGLTCFRVSDCIADPLTGAFPAGCSGTPSIGCSTASGCAGVFASDGVTLCCSEPPGVCNVPSPPPSPPPFPPPFPPPRWKEWWTGSARRDPHLTFAHGGHADFKGEDGAIYNLVSAKNVSFNAKFVYDDFHLPRKLVHGSYIGSAFWTLRTYCPTCPNWGPKRRSRIITVEFNASDAANPAIVRESGKPEAHNVYHGGGTWTADNVQVSVHGQGRTVVVSDGKWKFSVSSKEFPNADANPGKYLLHVSVDTLYDADSDVVAPHGLIGQSYDGDNKGIDGAQDDYRNGGSEMSTAAQAEGAIEGTGADYKVASAFATEFKFSRFDASKAAPRDLATLKGRRVPLVLGGSAGAGVAPSLAEGDASGAAADDETTADAITRAINRIHPQLAE